MFFESRYTCVDYAHRLFEVVRYLFVSTDIVHVKSVDLLSDPKSTETLLFTCAILGESIMHLLLNLELYWKGQGDEDTIHHHTLAKIKHQLLPIMLVCVGAVVTAAVLFAKPEDDEGDDYENRSLAGEAPPGGLYPYANKDDGDAYATEEGGYDKAYASSKASYYDSKEPIWTISDLPLTLMAVGFLVNIITQFVGKYRVTSGKFGDIVLSCRLNSYCSQNMAVLYFYITQQSIVAIVLQRRMSKQPLARCTEMIVISGATGRI